MSYGGTVKLLSGITQSGGKDFALVNSPAVLVDEDSDERLDTALSNLQSESYYPKYHADATNLGNFYLDCANIDGEGTAIFKASSRNVTTWENLANNGGSFDLTNAAINVDSIESTGTALEGILTNYAGFNSTSSFTILFCAKIQQQSDSETNTSLFKLGNSRYLEIQQHGKDGLRLIVHDESTNSHGYPTAVLTSSDDSEDGYNIALVGTNYTIGHYVVPVDADGGQAYGQYIHYAVVFDTNAGTVTWYANGEPYSVSQIEEDTYVKVDGGYDVDLLEAEGSGLRYFKIIHTAMTEIEIKNYMTMHNFYADYPNEQYDNALLSIEQRTPVSASCKTNASTTAKVATLSDTSRNISLSYGELVSVTFTYANTASNATLNINNTGAKTIYANGSRVSASNTWSTGETVTFVYTGYWTAIGSSNGFTSGAALKAADTAQEAAEAAQASADEKLEVLFLEDLPTAYYENNFNNGEISFINYDRTTVSNGDSYQRITASSTNAGNKYGIATLSFPDDYMTENTSSCIIEFDTRMSEGTRQIISIADLSKRPGDSNTTNHTTEGVVFRFGTINGLQWYVNDMGSTDVASYSTDWYDAWVHTKLYIDIADQTVTYTQTVIDTGTVLVTGTATWISITDEMDDGNYIPNGIETYTWLNGAYVDIDNITATTNYDTNETTAYVIGDSDNGYTLYFYNDGEAIKVSSSDSSGTASDDAIVSLSSEDNVITYTYGDGSTATLTVDYPVATTAITGLMDKTDKKTLDDLDEKMSVLNSAVININYSDGIGTGTGSDDVTAFFKDIYEMYSYTFSSNNTYGFAGFAEIVDSVGELNQLVRQNSNKGVMLGETANNTGYGAAIGNESETSGYGGAIGYGAITLDGGAVGSAAKTSGGGAIGDSAVSIDGGAVGVSAKTRDGFAGGYKAQTIDTGGNAIDAIQLGTGTNNYEQTLQVYDYQLLDANGQIPSSRIFGLPYGTCNTAYNTHAKTATVSGNFSLEAGAMVTVKFSNRIEAGNELTLNVNGTGAIPMSPNNIDPWDCLDLELESNCILTFVYDPDAGYFTPINGFAMYSFLSEQTSTDLLTYDEENEALILASSVASSSLDGGTF